MIFSPLLVGVLLLLDLIPTSAVTTRILLLPLIKLFDEEQILTNSQVVSISCNYFILACARIKFKQKILNKITTIGQYHRSNTADTATRSIENKVSANFLEELIYTAFTMSY